MKLKTLALLNEFQAPGPMTSGEHDLIPWDGIKEGKGYFLYCGTNNYSEGRSIASVTITEGNPKKFWIKIKTKKLRKPTDTNEGFANRSYEATRKVGRAWVSEAMKLFKEPRSIDQAGNLTMRTLEESFREALEIPKIKAVIESWGESKSITSYDKQLPLTIDPTNFTSIV